MVGGSDSYAHAFLYSSYRKSDSSFLGKTARLVRYHGEDETKVVAFYFARMLDSYHEEVRRKRNAYAIFWGVVFLFAVLLYMFFQGYYFSVQVGFERLIHGGSSQVTTSTGANDAVLKSFGIISMRVDPTPATMTVNGLPYQNGDKRIYDYGAYTMDIQNPGYLPIAIKIELSRLNPFYLNTVRLLEVPRETRFPETLRSIETLNGFAIAETFSGSFLYITAPYSGSGTPLGTSASGGILSSSLKNLGEGYFTGSGKIWSLDTTGKLIPTTLFSQESTKNTLCPEVKMIRGDMYCSKTGVFLTGKYKDLKEKIIEANPEFIRTESSIIRLGGTFFNSSTPITNSVSFSGASSLINYKDRLLVLNS